MKRILVTVGVAAILLSGCKVHEAVPSVTQPSETVELPILGQPGNSLPAVILGDIWAQYEPQERFSVYGGMVSQPVPDAPGDLDLQKADGWAGHCCFPVGCLQLVQEGASMTHLLNENLFTAVAVRVSDKSVAQTLTNDWRYGLQHGNWATVTPERLLLAQVAERNLVVAMGSKENLRIFRQKLLQAYPSAKIAYDEPITC